VSDRMDLTGARWSLPGAEAVLRLRALRSSSDFDEYWRFHEQREYERNHASRYADGKVVPVKGRHLKRVKWDESPPSSDTLRSAVPREPHPFQTAHASPRNDARSRRRKRSGCLVTALHDGAGIVAVGSVCDVPGFRVRCGYPRMRRILWGNTPSRAPGAAGAYHRAPNAAQRRSHVPLFGIPGSDTLSSVVSDQSRRLSAMTSRRQPCPPPQRRTAHRPGREQGSPAIGTRRLS